MLHLHAFGAVEVGDGARHLEYAVIGAGGEGESLHGSAQQSDGGFVGLGILVYHALGHLGIAVDALEVLVASGLNVAGLDDAFADDGAGLAWFHLGDVLEGYGCNLALDVDAV